ncbi:hypothetical protein SAMN05216480_10457 [Pustulibacterium marinum]|uniref:tRNA (Guanine-N1)-methyltransferase n=1 Tax=Pustulibacterium marinum TaxID=1224947 RepID=A0A1I7GB60_9FLAO|nr:hypothetical protein [Pustulibacterium marinum]SFU45682.1 hypothetical protein SAMN05216480_10457 [Pustulibacterium marinum]
MNYFRVLVLFFLLISVNFHATAQEDKAEATPAPSINSGSIAEQFEFVMEDSNQYGANMVVKKYYLTTLKAHILDSLNAVEKALAATEDKVGDQQTEIANLQENLKTTQATLDQTNLEKDSMSFFGILTSKGTYNAILCSVIGILVVLLVVFVYKFKNSNVITKDAQKALAETEEEYENHRRTALEREQKVRRQLQDELNKQKHKTV